MIIIVIGKTYGTSLVAQMVKAYAYNVGDLGSIPGLGRCPGEGNGNPSSILAWKIPWMEGPGRPQSAGSQRLGHNWATSLWQNLYLHYYYFCYNCDDRSIKNFEFLSKILEASWTHTLYNFSSSLKVEWEPGLGQLFIWYCPIKTNYTCLVFFRSRFLETNKKLDCTCSCKR